MSARGVVDAIAAVGLPGAAPLPDRPLADAEFQEVFALLTGERMLPALALAVDSGALSATDTQRAAIAIGHEQAMRVCVMLEHALPAVTARLERAGVDVRLLKGPAVAHLDYPDPSYRAFGDLDLLVRSAMWDAAIEALVTTGAARRYPEVRPGFDRTFGKGACLVEPDGTELDLHRTFVAGPFGLTIPLDELFRESEPVEIGGREYRALIREHRFVHACYHAALGDPVPRLAALRDIAQIALTTPLDVERTIAISSEWSADAVVAHAVKLTWVRLGLGPAPLSEWAFSHKPDGSQTRSLAAYRGDSRSYATQAVAGLRAVHGVPAKWRYARTMLVPDREYVASHDGTYLRRVRRAFRARSVAKAEQ
jgi:hypothetical protein